MTQIAGSRLCAETAAAFGIETASAKPRSDKRGRHCEATIGSGGNLSCYYEHYEQACLRSNFFILQLKIKQSIINYMPYKQYYVYIMTNKNNTVLYTGVTNDLKKRIYEHREKLTNGFTKKYNINKLVCYEIFDSVYQAISREKQIKAGSRSKKVMLINRMNEKWQDLYDSLF